MALAAAPAASHGAGALERVPEDVEANATPEGEEVVVPVELPDVAEEELAIALVHLLDGLQSLGHAHAPVAPREALQPAHVAHRLDHQLRLPVSTERQLVSRSFLLAIYIYTIIICLLWWTVVHD